MNRIKLKMDSRADLRGRLLVALQPLALMILISYVIGIFGTLSTRTDNEDLKIALSVINVCLSIAYGVVYFSLVVGVGRFYLKFINKEDLSWATVFDDLKSPKTFLQEFIAYVVSGLLIALGLILLLVPGIYLAVRYSQIKYVFAEHPETKWRDAMTRSADLMAGRCFEFFTLWLSFFWWYLLVVITLGLAALYVSPYLNCAMARYYKSLTYARDGNPEESFEDVFRATAYNSSDAQNPFDDTIYGTTSTPDDNDNPFEF